MTASIPLTIEQAGGAPYAGATSDDPTLLSVYLEALSATTGRLVVLVLPGHAPGTFNTFVRAMACSDSRCANVTRSEAYPVSVTILPRLSVSPASVAMTALEGGVHQMDLSVATPGAGTLSASVEASTGAWLEAQVVGANIVRLTARAGTRTPGAFNTSVVVGFNRTGGSSSSVRVPVTLTIGKGLVAPAAQQLTLDATTPAAGVTGSVSVTRADNAAAAWTAGSSADWLVLAPAAGTMPSTLGYSIDLGKAASLKNFADYTSTVTISAAGLAPVSFPVVLHKRVPFIATAMPYGIPNGVGSRVVLGGGGFMQYANLASALQTDGLAISGLQILSDTLIAFNVTPPRAGSYKFGLPVASSLPAQQAVLKVAAIAPYSPASVGHAGGGGKAVHDPVRQAVFVLSWGAKSIFKYQHVNGAWSVSAHGLQSPPSGVGLSPDGSRLLVTSADGIVQFNPDTMQLTASYPKKDISAGASDAPLAFTADNRLWLPTRYTEPPMQFLDLNNNAFGRIEPAPGAQYLGTPQVGGSADGSTVLMGPELFSSSYAYPWTVYNPATGSISTPTGWTEMVAAPQLSADGSRLLRLTGPFFDSRVHALYDNAYRLLGQLPSTPGLSRVALSADGSLIFAIIRVEGAVTTYRIDMFSTTRFSPGTTTFMPAGTLRANAAPAVCQGTSSNCDYPGVLLPSLDSKTLFWIGDKGMEVFRLP